MLNPGFVAHLTLDLFCIGMGASEQEVGPFMIEALFIEGGDILSSPLMFCVAFLAVLLLFESAMEALCVIDILADIFVAILAELRLCGLVESLMALGAGVFPLGMSLDHLPRHQSGFDGVRPGRLGQEEGG
jgi:hypothetical protein